ncbi:cytochrome P450 [Halenospora varia]|nr:cytochrome P450 [Halenospora varia]
MALTNSSSWPIIAVLGLASLLLLFTKFWGVRRFKGEPTYIEPKVPFIGHVIGMLQRKYDYYIDLSKRYKLQIYTLEFPGMPTGRLYIINSPELILAVQKQPKKLSFWHVEATFAERLAGLSPHGAAAILKNAGGLEDGPSLMIDAMNNIHQQLKPPSAELFNVTRSGMNRIAAAIDKFETRHETPTELGEWVIQNMLTCFTGGIYGIQSPFDDPEVVKGFLDFENNTVGLLSYPWPSITCRQAYIGREKVVTAFEKYFKSGGLRKASHFVQNGIKLSDGHKTSTVDKARFETINGHAILANTTPTTFWTVYHIFSDPKILEEVRAAVLPFLQIIEGDQKRYELDISTIRDIPILRSILHESLRIYGNGTGTRIVMEDTMLDDRYLLKKDSFIFMPNRYYHFDTSAWGLDANEFDPHRFMKPRPHQAGAFRGFGGGANLCPGRFFAMNEIHAMCAMLALRYDIKPMSGSWKNPGPDQSNLSFLVSPPKEKVIVSVVPRKGWEGGSWSYKLGH